MADTVDGAENALHRRQHSVDARNRLAQPAVVMDQFGTMALGNLAQMGNLAVAATDIEDGASLKPYPGLLFPHWFHRAGATVEMLVSLVFLGHLPIPLEPQHLSESSDT